MKRLATLVFGILLVVSAGSAQGQSSGADSNTPTDITPPPPPPPPPPGDGSDTGSAGTIAPVSNLPAIPASSGNVVTAIAPSTPTAEGLSPSSAPEPSTLCLAGIAALGMMGHRRWRRALEKR
jgi:hypothetical protein